MKKRIILTLLLSLFIEYNYGKSSITETENIILIKKDSHQVKPKSSASINIPIHATINSSFIEISFDYDIQNLNIYIENRQGDIVYDNTVSVSASIILPISIEGYNSGDYTIEFKYGNTILYGEISI